MIRRTSTAALVLALASLAACHHAQRESGKMIMVSGHGKLVSIDQTLGMGTLDMKGKQVDFWWNNQRRAPGLSVEDPESKNAQIPFQAKVGDTVYFRGLQTGAAIYITSAAVQK